jgi:hypothetical protein
MLDASFLFDEIPKAFTVLIVDYMLIREKKLIEAVIQKLCYAQTIVLLPLFGLLNVWYSIICCQILDVVKYWTVSSLILLGVILDGGN